MGTHPIFESDFDCLTEMVINCEFSAEALEDKLLNCLDKTQESVQELSRWLIKNHKNGDVVVKTWLKCLRQATSSTKKKSLIYLANDVLQNGIKKKTSYTDYYIPIMPIAFASFGICDQKLLKTLMNVLTVWETRNVFGSEYVNALRGALFAEQRKQLEQCIQEQQSSTLNEESLNIEESYCMESGPQTPPEDEPEVEDDRTAENIELENETADMGSARELTEASRARRAKKRRKKERKSSRSSRKRRRHEELGPKPEATIDLQKLELDVIRLSEEAASTDKRTREKLAKLPDEVQDEVIMEALTDANTLELLYQLVSRALSMVSQYTSKVKDEQIFRQTLWKAMKTVKQEQTALLKYERKELQNHRRCIEAFSTILDGLEEEAGQK